MFIISISLFLSLAVLFLLKLMTHKGSIGGGGSQACAVCKYQRRRCTKDCLLAPYFPSDQPKVFQNAHRLFGVANIQKILNSVHPQLRDEAVKSIKYESYMRAVYPVHGCCEVIWHLRYQLQMTAAQLQQIRDHIAAFKGQHKPEIDRSMSELAINPNYVTENIPVNNSCPPSEFYSAGGYNGNLPYANPADDMKPFLRPNLPSPPPPQYNQQMNQFSNFSNFQDQNMNNTCMNNARLQRALLAHQEIDVTNDYDELPFDSLPDDRQSFITSREGCESSAESLIRDDYIVENDLKNAAACFSLRNQDDEQQHRI